MSVPFAQYDNELSGGADVWDNGLAGIILSADYFQAPSGVIGRIKVWNGSAWVAKPVKVWNGSAWVTKPVKRWNGSIWVAATY